MMHHKRSWQTRSVPYVMLAPFLVLFFGFFIYPLFYSFYLSLFTARMGRSSFVGLANYAAALKDGSFWHSILTVARFGVMQLLIMLITALALALLLDSPVIRAKALFRLLYFLPYAVPGVIAALMWGFLYSPQLNPLLAVLGIFHHGKAPEVLSQGNLLYSIVNIVTWEWTGYNMTLYFAGLTSLPLELYDAAKIDGCNELQTAFRIKLPLIRPVIIFTWILSIIGTFQLFNEPFILSSLTVVPSDFTPNMYIYNMAFAYTNFHYSATLSFSLAFVTLCASLLFLFLTSGEGRAARRKRLNGNAGVTP
ncbi:MAG: sugar ABC transporter permease [Spirochaetia bacterium]|jgi:multiple sugar transport system permease protein